MIKISDRVAGIEPSQTVRLDTQAKRLIAEGKSVINLSVGELDFDPVTEVVAAAHAALDNDPNHYTNPQGMEETRKAVCEYLQSTHDLTYTVNQILITNGAKQALYSCFQALVNPGDEVIVPVPGWVSYAEQITLASGVPVFTSTTDQFQLDIDAMAEAITDNTVGIVLNYPNNPTGAVYPQEDLEKVAQLAERHDLWIISDEIYERLVYGENTFVSFAKLAYERAIIVNGVSKAGAMTGWRMGYIAGSEQFIERCKSLQSHLAGNVANVVQEASVVALRLADKSTAEYLQKLKERRVYLMDWIKTESHLEAIPPQGAFYIFIDVTSLTHDSEEFCERLLNDFGVAIVPGKYFGKDGYIRMSFANSLANIEEACKRISNCVASYT